ncbi:MAG TPA: aminoacyl-tRNA hydrolase [Alphaproteobacteria bacterium]|nr:aminoacyl-tRNA hydrolase [Alphaproteobacteria bacterium]
MYLLVGLGNPGREYAHNRHNVGFMCIDEIQKSYGFAPEKSKFSGLLSEGRVDQTKVYLFKPLAFMNRSGRPVGETSKFFKIPPEHVIVFHDDLDLAPGKVRVKQGGSHGGHNGLRDLDAHIGTQYWRVRIGIGRPLHKGAVTSYVLSDFSKEEKVWLDPLISCLADEVDLLLTSSPESYAAKIMQTLPPPHSKTESSHGI